VALHEIRITLHPKEGGDETAMTVVTNPNPCYIRPGDRVEWGCADAPFAIHFEPQSPLLHRRLRAPGGQIGDDVRGDIHPGKYRYFVAVAVGNQIYTEDPELIDENN
jgi:hypothetical protein